MRLKHYIFAIMLAIPLSVRASGIPTVDIVGNLQMVLDYAESLSQTTQQAQQIYNEVEMIRNQIAEAERQIQNMQRLGNYDWADMNAQLSKLEQAAMRTNALVYASGDMEGSYEAYRDQAYYESNTAQYNREQTVQRWNNNAMATTKSSAAVLDRQAELLTEDAQQLSRLQGDVSGAEGQMAAQQAGSQLQAFTAQQLMYVRQLQMNEQQILIQRRAEEAERNAIITAAESRLDEPMTNTPSNRY
ncbi:hypothetical protein [Microbulbifer discodermiae]|uniref:hypothetical protein n=1 Tax=Microbulbifer sp. 2201CG32-9 TaxID=3232309 RepID=UPI00345B96B9